MWRVPVPLTFSVPPEAMVTRGVDLAVGGPVHRAVHGQRSGAEEPAAGEGQRAAGGDGAGIGEGEVVAEAEVERLRAGGAAADGQRVEGGM